MRLFFIKKKSLMLRPSVTNKCYPPSASVCGAVHSRLRLSIILSESELRAKFTNTVESEANVVTSLQPLHTARELQPRKLYIHTRSHQSATQRRGDRERLSTKWRNKTERQKESTYVRALPCTNKHASATSNASDSFNFCRHVLRAHRRGGEGREERKRQRHRSQSQSQR